jgi:hypothetical protein
MKTLITLFMFILVITYTSVNFGMRSMADQPLTSTTHATAPEQVQKHEIQQIPEHHTIIRTPAGLVPVDTPLTTTPDLEHSTHMIMPHIGKVVPRDYAHWSFD